MPATMNYYYILIYLCAYLLVVFAGQLFVRHILKKFPLNAEGGLKKAGAAIGILERVLTLTFVLIGQYTAIALVLTAKSIARYKELENRNFAEYYLIGTLASMLFALLVGIGVMWILSELGG